jgi:hypothetical protein
MLHNAKNAPLFSLPPLAVRPGVWGLRCLYSSARPYSLCLVCGAGCESRPHPRPPQRLRGKWTPARPYLRKRGLSDYALERTTRVRTALPEVAVLRQVRVLPAELAAAPVRVDALVRVLRTSRREVASPVAHKTGREREGIVRVHRRLTFRERVSLGATPDHLLLAGGHKRAMDGTPVADADGRFVTAVGLRVRTVPGLVPRLTARQTRHVYLSYVHPFLSSRFRQHALRLGR